MGGGGGGGGGAKLYLNIVNLLQEVCDMVLETLSSSSLPSTVTLVGVKLLRRCLEYSGYTPISRAVRVLQNLTRHSSSEVSTIAYVWSQYCVGIVKHFPQVCEESRHGLALCSLLLHPAGPPWGSHSGAISSEGGPLNQPSSVDLIDTQRTVFPTVRPSASGVNSTTMNGPLQEPQLTMLAQNDSRKRRREGEGEMGSGEGKEEGETEAFRLASREDIGRGRGCEGGEEVEGGKGENSPTVVGREKKGRWGEVDEKREGSGEKDAVLGSGDGRTIEYGSGCEEGKREEGGRWERKEDAPGGSGKKKALLTERGEGRKKSGGRERGDRWNKGEVRAVEEGGGEEEEAEEEGMKEGGSEERDDSDVEDIIATFCSSPSNTDSSN